MDRIVALVDMDCFYVQVEQKLNPDLKGKPCAVVQYTGRGVIIAVNYEARPFGVSRGMSKEDAKAKCPDILFAKVPELRGKADLTKYRDAGAEVIKVFSQFCHCVERASIDEAYLDLTQEVEAEMKNLPTNLLSLADQLPNTHVIGWEENQTEMNGSTNRTICIQNWLEAAQSFHSEMVIKLAIGGCLVEKIRAAILEQTGFHCSAGVSCNKMLAKLAAGLHKPNQQTILPHASVTSFFMTVPLKKIRNLGGKLGNELCDQHGVKNMSDLCQFSKEKLLDLYGRKTGLWLYAMCRGYDYEPVAARQLPKSIGCSKNFQGKEALDTKEKVRYWLSQLAIEVEERLIKDKEENKRIATSIIVGCRHQDLISKKSITSSRTVALTQYNRHKFSVDAFSLLQQFNTSPPDHVSWSPPINMLSMSAGKFVDIGVVQYGGISALLRKQMNHSKPKPLVSLEPEFVPPNKETTNDKKETNKPIMNFFSQQQISSSEEKSEDGISCSKIPQDLPDESLINFSQEESKKAGKKISSFFTTKENQMNFSKKNDFSSDSDSQVNSSFSRQTIHDACHTSSNSKSTILRFFSKNSEPLTLTKDSSLVSEDLTGSKCCPLGSNMTSSSSCQQNNFENDLILLSDNESSDVDSFSVADSNFFQGNPTVQTKESNFLNHGSTVNQIQTLNDECSKVNTSLNTSIDSRTSSINMNQITMDRSCNSTVQAKESNFFNQDPTANPIETLDDECNKVNISLNMSIDSRNPSINVNQIAMDRSCKTTTSNGFDAEKVINEPCDSTSEILVASNSSETISDDFEFVKCEECLKKVSVHKLEEHQDFHFAQKLQQSVNAEERTASSHFNSMKKRKGKTLHPTHKKKNKTDCNTQTLDLFFKK